MLLLLLLLMPVAIGIVGLVLGKGHVTIKELAVQEAAIIVLISVGYYVAYQNRMADTELWSGRVARKWRDTGSCCHSYQCNPHPCNCDSKGNCSTCYDTCYEHISDKTWEASSTNGERIYSQGCGRPHASDPARWTAIQVGEPTAVAHSYDNYIKGNPDTIMKRQGAAERFPGKLPAYPEVFDLYRANRLITVGVSVPERARFVDGLENLNANLGALKKVNLIVVVVNESSEMYLEALREHWIGGKKNDLVAVIGAPHFPEIAWVGVLSWTKSEEAKIAIRDRLLALGTWNGDAVLNVVKQETVQKFVHRPITDFEYLKATIEPTRAACWIIFTLGCVLSLALSVFFWKQDPFGNR